MINSHKKLKEFIEADKSRFGYRLPKLYDCILKNENYYI